MLKRFPGGKPGSTLPAPARRIGGSRLAPGKRSSGGFIESGSASDILKRFRGGSRGPWQDRDSIRPSSHRYAGIEIDPLRVVLFDQLDLPVALPTLDPPFTDHRRFQCVVTFEPDQPIDVVFCGEPWNSLHLMVPHPPNKIGGGPDVQGSVRFTREHLYKKHWKDFGVGPGLRRESERKFHVATRRRPTSSHARKPGRPARPLFEPGVSSG
jgi:hypothetical protein